MAASVSGRSWGRSTAVRPPSLRWGVAVCPVDRRRPVVGRGLIPLQRPRPHCSGSNLSQPEAQDIGRVPPGIETRCLAQVCPEIVLPL